MKIENRSARQEDAALLLKARALVEQLEALATKDLQAAATRRGVRVEAMLGVTTGNIRKLAKTTGQDYALAQQLWSMDIHEAKILAILLAPLAEQTEAELTRWVASIQSWGICDHFAKKLAETVADVLPLVQRWVAQEALYTRRVGLALIANFCMRQHALEEALVPTFAEIILQRASDERQHVKQACCWALRELGKIDTQNHEVAINLALELMEAPDKPSAWVGRCAYKELETLIKVPERRRLISRHSKTGAKYSS